MWSTAKIVALLLKFGKTYWKEILLALLVLFALKMVHDHGYNKADAEWIKFHNKRVGELNAKIEKIEQDSRTEAETLKADAESYKWALLTLAKEFKTIKPKDKDGKVLVCDGKEVDTVYLGQDFTDAWNKLNTKGESK
jgi:hypothetical protein